MARGDNSHNSITLGPRDKLIGSLTFDGDLTVAGKVEGEVHATGDIAVENGSSVKAVVEGNNVTVQGTIHGNVSARGRLSLSGSGSLHGDVRVSKLTVEDGATLNGNVQMGGPSVGGGKGANAESEHHAENGHEEHQEQPQPEAVG
ncbi:MAG: polymer-forming cytoskeletal protein [Candidatus Dormibacteraeota bacterium]|nr:polymer-forming cytoskeletal protein [Candidatus Dormibacteraeota bacterium]